MFKLFDFRCRNSECLHQEELMVPNSQQEESQPCPSCGGEMFRVMGGKKVEFDEIKRQRELKKKSQEHTAQAIKDGRPLSENESGKCSDPVWNNKTRPKNTSPYTLSQHKYDHLK